MSLAVATAGRPSRLLSNTAWNLAGQLLPLAVALLTLPLLIRLLGLERFGFISLVWVLVGYASVFDFGIGRAVIRTVASHLAASQPAGAQRSAHAGLFFLLLFGLILALVLSLLSGVFVTQVLHLPTSLQEEALPATLLLAASLPFVMLTIGFGGVLSAHQCFKPLNLARILMGVASYLGPVAVALWTPRLDAVVAMVLAVRVAGMVVHAWVCARECGWRLRWALPDRASTRELFTLGGWMAVSNIVGPVLTYLDRLLLGALVPVRMVAVYATPYDVLSKAMILASSMMASIFPRAASADRGSEGARQLLNGSTRLLFVTMFPVMFGFVVFARPGLRSWLGPEIADPGALVMQILAVGMLLNALAQGPGTLIQAAGEPRWMAKLHLIELPLFVALLWALTVSFGVVGTAVASSLRNAVDTLAVVWMAQRRVARSAFQWRAVRTPAALAVVLMGAAFWPETWLQALIVGSLGVVAFVAYAWARLLTPAERQRLVEFSRKWRAS